LLSLTIAIDHSDFGLLAARMSAFATNDPSEHVFRHVQHTKHRPCPL